MSVAMLFVDHIFAFYFNLLYEAKFLYGTLGIMLGILICLYVVAAVTFLGAVAIWYFSR